MYIFKVINAQRIVSTKNAIVSNGVDFSREERLAKCDKIIASYKEIYYSNAIETLLKIDPNDEVSTIYIIPYIASFTSKRSLI